MGLLDEIQSNLVQTMQTRALKRCSRWAEFVRYMQGEDLPVPWSFRLHPWLREVHDDNTQNIVIMKAAQMGFTEFAINRTLYTLDQLHLNVLYALPNERPDAMNFSRGRLNAAAALSPYIDQLFTRGKSENHKITKDYANLYIRGARSRSCFKQIDVSLVVLDELDEMGDEGIELARYRSSGQTRSKQMIMLSTPSYGGVGIHKQFQDTSQAEFFFKCPHCSKFVNLTYPECLVVTADTITDKKVYASHLVCPSCRKPLDHDAKPEFLANGVWVHKYPDRPIAGYHINQLYSCAAKPHELAQQEIRGRYNVQSKIEFYNSSLGLTFTPEGAKLTEKDLNDCQQIHEYLMDSLGESRDRLVTIGVDIGQEVHHYAVVGWQFDPTLSTRDITIASVGKLLSIGTVKELGELDEIFEKWQPRFCVLDAQPETRAVKAFCKKWHGIAYACYYSLKRATRDIVTGNVNEKSVSVNRTYWLDATLGKIHKRQMMLPRDLPLEARAHLISLTKAYNVDDKGDVVAEYIKRQGDADHFAHALNYAMIALGMSAGKAENETM